MTGVDLNEFSWERMIAAVEDVRERACRAANALKQAGIRHVVVGGNAVASWVARVEKEAVRNTKDVDVLIRREDFARVIDVLDVGLIDESWCARVPAELATRLKELLDSPERQA